MEEVEAKEVEEKALDEDKSEEKLEFQFEDQGPSVPLTETEGESSASPIDDTGERSRDSVGIHMQVYKMDLKNPGDTYENESKVAMDESIKKKLEAAAEQTSFIKRVTESCEEDLV